MTKKQKEQFKGMEKNIIKLVKSYAKEYKYKAISNSLYKKVDDFFLHSIYFIAHKEDVFNLVAWNYIKTCQSDNLFWEIFDMEDNKNQKDSLRANGAYTVPSLKINEYSLDIAESTDLEEVSRTLVKFISEEHNGFVSMYKDSKTFNRYLLKQSGYYREELIKMLANIELQDFEEAQRMAQKEIIMGNRGGFRNNDKDIYHYLLEYCKKQ